MGVDTVLVVVERLTKYAHFISIAHPFTAKEVAAVFIKEVIRLNEFPNTIISNELILDRVISYGWHQTEI